MQDFNDDPTGPHSDSSTGETNELLSSLRSPMFKMKMGIVEKHSLCALLQLKWVFYFTDYLEHWISQMTASS